MSKPHKHAEVIKAWADGKQIQFKRYWDTEWTDCLFNPRWTPDIEYRVKPETLKYRVALMSNGRSFTLSANSEGGGASIEDQCSFVRWLTDWIEVEV